MTVPPKIPVKVAVGRTVRRNPAVQRPFDAAVIVTTVIRPSLLEAVRSVYAQDLDGRVQIVIGIDVPLGDPAIIEQIRGECPPHMSMMVVDPGYSTSQRHGGLYRNGCGGVLPTVSSYLANSRYVAYLDDDNWFAPNHLSSMLAAIQGHDWAFSYRWFVDPYTRQPLCIDEWESRGPDQGVFKPRFGGFVDTNCLMIDKMRCHHVLPQWARAPFKGAVGADRCVFDALRRGHKAAGSGLATSYYVMYDTDQNHAARVSWLRSRGVEWVPAGQRAGAPSLDDLRLIDSITPDGELKAGEGAGQRR